MVLLASLAFAGSSATSFATDPGEWEGGELDDGVLSLDNEEASLAIDGMVSFTFTARVRVVEGDGLSLSFGDQRFDAIYGEGGHLAFSESTAPFAIDERAFEAANSPVWTPGDSVATLSDPDVVSFGGMWWMAATTVDADGASSISVASSFDLDTWDVVDAPILLDAASPGFAAVGSTLSMLAARDGSLFSATSTDGESWLDNGTVLSPGPDYDAGGLDLPSVTVDADGTWRLWYNAPETGATGYATSTDGATFTRESAISDDSSRLYGMDVVDGAFGLEAVYSMGDSLGWTVGDSDVGFNDEASDVRPLVSADDAAWADGGLGTPAVVYDGDDVYVFVAASDDGESVIGRFDGIPTPGSWVTLSVTWDGETATVSWNGGPEMIATESAVDSFTLLADGIVEIDEAEVEYAEASDTGVADTGDTGAADTADSAVAWDSADTGVNGRDSADTGGAGFNAGEWLGDPGGCGCNGSDIPVGGLLSLTGIMTLLSRTRRTSNARGGSK